MSDQLWSVPAEPSRILLKAVPGLDLVFRSNSLGLFTLVINQEIKVGRLGILLGSYSSYASVQPVLYLSLMMVQSSPSLLPACPVWTQFALSSQLSVNLSMVPLLRPLLKVTVAFLYYLP